MLILDCENYDAILNSIENIFNVKSNVLTKFLKSINLDETFRNEEIDVYGYQYLYQKFIRKFSEPRGEIKAYWFHNTRVPINTDFKEGILPLQDAIPKVEKIIENIVTELKINHNSKSLLSCDVIQHKLKTVTDSGPWGFLIKEFAFEVPEGIHDYLEIPELVQDITQFRYKNQYKEILSEFKRITTSCIVKFSNDRNFHSDNLSYVIYYLYHKENNLDLDIYCNANTSNYGQKIPFDKIENIEFF